MQRSLVKDRHLTRLFIILAVAVAALSILKPSVFLSAANFRSMAVQFPELGFLSIAAALVLMAASTCPSPAPPCCRALWPR